MLCHPGPVELFCLQMSEQMLLYYKAKRASSDCIRKKLFLPSLFQDFFNWHMKTDITAGMHMLSLSGANLAIETISLLF